MTSDGHYTVLDENPPKVPSFIRAPHSTTFAEWLTSSCWYKIWCEVYKQSDNIGKVRKRSRFSKKIRNVADGKDGQDVEVVCKRRKIEQDTFFSHENAMEEKQNEEEDNVKKVITKDTKLVEGNELDQVKEYQQHDDDNVNKLSANEEMENVNKVNVDD